MKSKTFISSISIIWKSFKNILTKYLRKKIKKKKSKYQSYELKKKRIFLEHLNINNKCY